MKKHIYLSTKIQYIAHYKIELKTNRNNHDAILIVKIFLVKDKLPH